MDNRLHFYGQGSTPSCVRALRSLFMWVIQDINTDKNGEEYIQKNIRRVHRYWDNIGEHNQEVCIKAPNKNFEDKWFTNKYIGTLQVINSADIKLGVTSEIWLLFKHPNNWGKSPNTHKALLGLFNAMQEDSKKRSHISVEFRKKLKGNSY
jgi:hypothetical protein